MIHKCTKGSCQTEKFKGVFTKDGKKEKVTETNCHFNFPFDLNGFTELKRNEETKEFLWYEPDNGERKDPLTDPLHYGASYKKLDERKQKFINPI